MNDHFSPKATSQPEAPAFPRATLVFSVFEDGTSRKEMAAGTIALKIIKNPQ
jgi:hypothetical protein